MEPDAPLHGSAKPIVLIAVGDGFQWPCGLDAIGKWGSAWLAWPDTPGSPVGTAHMSPEAAAKRLGALLPPRVGDRWGDLTMEQRAEVREGSTLGPAGPAFCNTLIAVPGDAQGLRWATVEAGSPSPAHDSDGSVNRDRRIVRLSLTSPVPSEGDRSGWPMLVRVDDATYSYGHPAPHPAVVRYGADRWTSWEPVESGDTIGKLKTHASAAEAAEYLHARLPDEAPRTAAGATDTEREAATVKAGRFPQLRLDNGTSWPAPLNDEELADKLNCYHSETVTLTRNEAWALRSIVGAYDHLATHPAGVESAVKALRSLRRAVRRA